MKELVQKAKSFITFDLPLQTAFISSQFADKHEKFHQETTGWSTIATRQILIFEFWFRYVAGHFGIVFGLPALIIYFFHRDPVCTCLHLIGIFTAGIISYSILYLFHYRPWFSGIFLPKLETAKEIYEQKQIAQLEKCRQAQLSNFSLTLVFYVFDKAAGMNSLQCTDGFSSLLMKLYGVDKGSLKKNLELIFTRKKSISERRSTEIRNRFSEAYSFFEELNYFKGITILKELETKFFNGQLVNEINFPN